MRSLKSLSLSALFLGHAIASPIATTIGQDDNDIIINIYGSHRIVINEIAETAACSGSDTSSPHRLEAGPGASAQGPPPPNLVASPGVTIGGGSAGDSTGGAPGGSPAGSPPANQPSPPASQPTVLIPACDPALDRSSLDHLLLNPKQDFYYTQQGIGSDVTPAFQAEGSVTASVTPYVKVALEFTFGLLQGRFSRSLALVGQPSITTTANVAGEAGWSNGQLTGSFTNGCKGVLVEGTFRNQLYVDIFGVSTKTLLDYTTDPISRCLGTPIRRALLARQGLAANSTETTVSIMQSIDGNFDLHAGEDGNVYSISSNDATDALGDDTQVTSSQFQALGTTIVADSKSRILHGYTDTLSKFGVSRLRFSPASAIPQTARVMALDPSQNPDGGDSLGIQVARDTATNVFHLATCVYDKKYPKVFLVAANNVEAGLKKLESNDADMIKSVTGGRVKQCGLLAYANGYSKF